MPARNITPRHRYLSGRVASSNKGAGPQAFESMLEQDFLLMLEFDWGVNRFASQPITIRWQDHGKHRRYTPDVLVEYTTPMMALHPHLKPTLFEVKPEAVLRRDWTLLKPRFKAAIRWCREYDCRFRIITERYIQTPYLNNIKFLLQFKEERFKFVDRGVMGQKHALLRTHLFELGRTTPQGLLDDITNNRQAQAELIPYLWHLVRCNSVGIDLSLPLSMYSPIWAREDGMHLAMTLTGSYKSRIQDILAANHVEVPSW